MYFRATMKTRQAVISGLLALLWIASCSTPNAEAQRAVPNPIVNETFSHCTDMYFGSCSFDGLRTIRFGVGNKWFKRTYLSSFAGSHCTPARFGGDPAPGETKTCQVSNIMKTGTIPAPVTTCGKAGGSCPIVNLTQIPLGVPGIGYSLIKPTTQTPIDGESGAGAFRTTCMLSHFAFEDPIVFPNQPGQSHLHVFFGNTGVTAFSNASDIANRGNSTCSGGTANRSAYWVPALIDAPTGKPVVPQDSIWYYKTGYTVPVASIQPMPEGLRMVAGNVRATGPQPNTWWTCLRNTALHVATIPNCQVNDHLEMVVRFPQCWDGVNLDSADHKSHMAFPTRNGCPASHPVPIPEITLNLRYLVRVANEPLRWRLSSDNTTLGASGAGLSAHGDWWNGWVPSVRDTWVTRCDNAAKNCLANLLGDGTILASIDREM